MGIELCKRILLCQKLQNFLIDSNRQFFLQAKKQSFSSRTAVLNKRSVSMSSFRCSPFLADCAQLKIATSYLRARTFSLFNMLNDENNRRRGPKILF